MTSGKLASDAIQPLRILITALGGEGGATLMNWLVAAARNTGYTVQATSVPGVAQRTGATSYYLEIAAQQRPAVLSLLPLPGRVDLVICSELVEAARMLEAGFVSPERTTLIASHSRTYAIAEKIQMADGRYDTTAIENAARSLSHRCCLIDLQTLADENQTYISTTLFAAAAVSGTLPWDVSSSRALLEGSGNLVGFDAAAAAVQTAFDNQDAAVETVPIKNHADHSVDDNLDSLTRYAIAMLTDYQDAAYAELYKLRMQKLIDAADALGTQREHVLKEAARRLANWMAYEDIARVADLKTRPERFAEVRTECRATDAQILRITEYLKPRAEEIADMLPAVMGEKLIARVRRGKTIPLLGTGRRVPSNAAWGYWLLRSTAALKRYRRKSLRFIKEQEEIDLWLNLMLQAQSRSPEFALALAELPRLRKGYSDTLLRGLDAYHTILDTIVKPAIDAASETNQADRLSAAIKAAFADEHHEKLQETVVKFYPQGTAHPATK